MDAEQIAVILFLLTVIGWSVGQLYFSLRKKVQDLEDNDRVQDLQIVLVKANIEHIRSTLDETSKDVKEILKLNGKRTTG
jgi:hypothetical protein